MADEDYTARLRSVDFALVTDAPTRRTFSVTLDMRPWLGMDSAETSSIVTPALLLQNWRATPPDKPLYEVPRVATARK